MLTPEYLIKIRKYISSYDENNGYANYELIKFFHESDPNLVLTLYLSYIDYHTGAPEYVFDCTSIKDTPVEVRTVADLMYLEKFWFSEFNTVSPEVMREIHRMKSSWQVRHIPF